MLTKSQEEIYAQSNGHERTTRRFSIAQPKNPKYRRKRQGAPGHAAHLAEEKKRWRCSVGGH